MTTSKKIHVVTKYFYPVAAGIETNILETYSVLVRKGWDVTLHTSKDEYLTKNSLPDTEVIRGIKVVRYPFKSELLGFWPKINWQEKSVVCLHNFNTFFWQILLYSLWLKLTGRKKFGLVLTPHGGFNPEWSIFNPVTALLKQIYHYTIGTFLINTVVDKVRAVSEWERTEIIKRGVKQNKIVTISNGLEDEAYANIDKLASPEIKLKVKKLGKYLIQIGRIYQIKNYETVIKALPLIPKDIKFVIVGQSEKNLDYKNGLTKQAEDLGIGDRLVFLGVVRGIDKYYVIKHAQMMVHMAIWESFCNVVHEGMSQGLICIVANAYALPFLVKEGITGFLVNTFDYQTLADKINYILKNLKSSKIINMKKNSREFGLQDSWQNVAGRMDKLYSNI